MSDKSLTRRATLLSWNCLSFWKKITILYLVRSHCPLKMIQMRIKRLLSMLDQLRHTNPRLFSRLTLTELVQRWECLLWTSICHLPRPLQLWLNSTQCSHRQIMFKNHRNHRWKTAMDFYETLLREESWIRRVALKYTLLTRKHRWRYSSTNRYLWLTDRSTSLETQWGQPRLD